MIEYGLSNIPSLVSAWDIQNPRCYSGTGSTWYDLITGLPAIGDPYWLNNIMSLTISMVFEKTNNFTAYSANRIYKYNRDSQDNSSLYFYHFGNYLGNGQDGNLGWYGNNTQDLGTGWTPLTYTYVRAIKGFKYHVVLQYSSITGGWQWINGQKVGPSASAGGMLGHTILSTNNTTTNVYFDGPLDNGVDRIHHIQFYNRTLFDHEIMELYQTHKSRFRLG